MGDVSIMIYCWLEKLSRRGGPTAIVGGGGAVWRFEALCEHQVQLSPFSGQSPYFVEVFEFVLEVFHVLFVIAIPEFLRL